MQSTDQFKSSNALPQVNFNYILSLVFYLILHFSLNSSLYAKAADNTRSDSLDILHITIDLDIVDFSTQSISGSCTLEMLPLIDGISIINLDLLSLIVDSVFLDGEELDHTYDGVLLEVETATPLIQGDTFELQVYYHGNPVKDPLWGGFYFQGEYAYNMGVAFELEPHNFGRVWYPCFDNFVEKATYSFRIRTSDSRKAFCNGLLENMTDNGDGTKTWHWEMSEPIPTYLTSVAISDYATVERVHSGLEEDILIQMGARPGDTLNLVNSFVNLPAAIDAFEESYGPHQFSRVGFVVVPFNGGAMEHATNIAYPRFAVNGGLDYESLYAHELSHHWWGDLMTCETAEDMWLNEGWASWSERLFFERVYGKERYKEEIRANHKDVIHFTHIRDDGYRAVSGIPHEYTYGSTVYDKGADIAHTLRGYLGDDTFFDCITGFLETYAFKNAGSLDFRDYLSSCSGINLEPFFRGWVFNPGFPHFSIDSVYTEQLEDGHYFTRTYLRQRLNNAPEFYDQVPLELSFMGADWQAETRLLYLSGECGYFDAIIPFEPVYTALDMDEKLSDAITDNYVTVTIPVLIEFEEAMMDIEVLSLSDSAFLRVEHHWVAPRPMDPPVPGLHLSDYRYWTVGGVFPSDFLASATVLYNGLPTTGGGYLDNTFITNSEDSLLLMYRRDATEEWTIYGDYSLNTWGTTMDKRGQIDIFNLRPGDYSLAIKDYLRPVADPELSADCASLNTAIFDQLNRPEILIYPVPASEKVLIEVSGLKNRGTWSLLDLTGRTLVSGKLNNEGEAIRIETKSLQAGTYLFNLNLKDSSTYSRKVIIIH